LRLLGLLLCLLFACGPIADSDFGADEAADDDPGDGGDGQDSGQNDPDDSPLDCGLCDSDIVIRALADLEFASNCQHITGTLEIMQNSNMVAIDSLELLACLEGIDGDLLIGRGFMTELVYLHGLEGLTSVGGNVVIDNNDKLAGLDGLSGLASIGGDLVLYDNDELGQIDGLTVLTSIGGSLDIRDSDMLTDVGGLESVETIAGDLDISWNATLCQDHAESVASAIDVGGVTQVDDNLGACP